MADRVFAMPDLGEGLEEGEIVAWLVNVGDDVALNQPLVEVETAKATVEIPSPYVGRVVTLHGAVGDAIPVGTALITISVAISVEDGRPPAAKVAATPTVRKLAKQMGVDLSTVAGTGPDGRITSKDVTLAAGGEVVTIPSGDVEVATLIPITPVRSEIAKRLTEVAAIPQVTTFRTLDCSVLERFRLELEVSPLPVFVSALARVCRDHPLLNASWTADGIQAFHSVHVGIAADTKRGLMVPVLRGANELGIDAISQEIRRLAEAARGGHLQPNDLRGATIGVSNTGSYGSEAGTPLLNPGNAVTVALGVIAPRALVVDGEVVARPACTLSMTFDHRVLDGAAVGRALTDLVVLLQDAGRLRDLPR
ncbi:MAG: dihydrolipoamide acetyltransferase family protein [Actinomycetota bacterium]